MNSKQTAVQWFNQQLVDRQNGNGDSRSWDKILQQALEMEREQIVEAYQAGDGGAYSLQDTKLWGQEFYNERYQGGKNEK
jgi:hypothetical protein